MQHLLEVQQNSEFIARLDLTENTEGQRLEIIAKVKDLYGCKAICQWHDCYHDEGKPCPSPTVIK